MRSTGTVRALVRCLAVLLLVAATARGQVVYDEAVATVNGDLILKSDVLWGLALDPEVKVEEFWDPKIQEMMLRTLVDQRLLLQEAEKLPATRATDAEVEKLRAEITANVNTRGRTEFEERLRLVGLTSDQLDRMLRNRLQITKFIDFRFRSFVVVTDPEIRAYFDAEIKPALEDQTPAFLESSLQARRAEIERALIEEKINDSIDVYLEDARARAEIVTLQAL
jgi:hypothetical protein